VHNLIDAARRDVDGLRQAVLADVVFIKVLSEVLAGVNRGMSIVMVRALQW